MEHITHNVLIWASASVGPLCFIQSRFNKAVNQLEHFMLGDADFFFQQDLALDQTAKSTKNWFNVFGITVLDRPSN